MKPEFLSIQFPVRILLKCSGQRYEKPAVFPASKAVIGWTRGHIHCYYSFLRAVTDGKPAPAPLEEGVCIQNLLAKVKESAASGRWVKV